MEQQKNEAAQCLAAAAVAYGRTASAVADRLEALERRMTNLDHFHGLLDERVKMLEDDTSIVRLAEVT